MRLSAKHLSCREDLADRPGEAPTRTIVFSTFTSALDLLEQRLRATDIDWVRLDGSMAIQARTDAVRNFARNPQVPPAAPQSALSERPEWVAKSVHGTWPSREP